MTTREYVVMAIDREVDGEAETDVRVRADFEGTVERNEAVVIQDLGTALVGFLNHREKFQQVRELLRLLDEWIAQC